MTNSRIAARQMPPRQARRFQSALEPLESAPNALECWVDRYPTPRDTATTDYGTKRLSEAKHIRRFLIGTCFHSVYLVLAAAFEFDDSLNHYPHHERVSQP